MVRLSPEALDVLRDARVDGTSLYLPDQTIDLTTQLEVDEALRLAGGVWKSGAYRFLTAAGPVVERMVLAGVVRPAEPPVVLSYGMGVESTSILLRWLEDPSSRNFELSQLILITAQTGDEFRDLGPLIQEHLIPRLVRAGVRWVQVARVGVRQEDGIVVLEDSRSPTRAHIDGAFKLSDELTSAGTVPQVASGRRLCSLKAKGWPLDTWLEREMSGRRFRHIMGFNADEQTRMSRDSSYSTYQRSSEYPLAVWGWNREACERYIHDLTGVVWPKSCCSYCPFAYKVNSADMIKHLDRFRADPEAAAQALLLEHVSLALNPRMALYASRSLRSVIEETPGMGPVLEAFKGLLEALPWAVYRVRRYYHARGRADRKTDFMIKHTSSDGAHEALFEFSGDVRHEAGAARIYTLHRGSSYPTREEFYVAAPALPVEKSRAGFNARWAGV